MGYSTNPALVEQRRPALAELEAGRACRWTFQTTDPSVLRRRANEIREALYIARLYPDRFPELAAAAEAFSIHVVYPSVIEARPKQGRDVQLNAHALVPQHGTQPWGVSQPTVGITTADEAIHAWRLHLPSNDPVHFPQSSLSVAELTKLHQFAVINEPRLMLFAGDGFLTLALREIGAEPYAWSPPAAPVEPEPDIEL